jgi:hypothetical protein
MFDQLTTELLDLTATSKGRRRSMFAMLLAGCSSCCCCCGTRTGDN